MLTIAAPVSLMLLIGDIAWSNYRRPQQAYAHCDGIRAAIEKIKSAELKYSETSPGHAFTCNGPNLPGFEPNTHSLNSHLFAV